MCSCSGFTLISARERWLHWQISSHRLLKCFPILRWGRKADCAVPLLLKELFICERANISAPLTTVYLGGPRLAPDLGLSGIAVFDPFPAVSLFSGCGPLHPQIQHMDPAFKGEVQ